MYVIPALFTAHRYFVTVRRAACSVQNTVQR
jgi:hypothetical protein